MDAEDMKLLAQYDAEVRIKKLQAAVDESRAYRKIQKFVLNMTLKFICCVDFDSFLFPAIIQSARQIEIWRLKY